MACVFLHSQLLQKPRPWLRVQFHTWIRRWFQPAVFSLQGAGRSCLPRSPGASGSLVALDNHLSLVQSLPRRSQRGQPGPASRCPDQAIPLGKTPRQPLCCQSSVTSCFTGSFLKTPLAAPRRLVKVGAPVSLSITCLRDPVGFIAAKPV